MDIGFELAGLPGFVAVGSATAARRNHLSAAEREILGSRATDTRRSDFAAGRAAARIALQRLGIPGTDVLKGSGGEPLWPPGVVGSIAHSAGLAMAMVARTTHAAAIGLDLERRRPVEEITDFVAFDGELAWLASKPDLSEDRLIELFAAKEAVFKAVFPMVHRHFGFEAVHLTPGEPGFLATVVSPDILEMGVPAEIDVHVQWDRQVVIAWVVLPSS